MEGRKEGGQEGRLALGCSRWLWAFGGFWVLVALAFDGFWLLVAFVGFWWLGLASVGFSWLHFQTWTHQIEVFPNSWDTVPTPPPKQLQIIFGPPEFPVVCLFVGRLSQCDMPMRECGLLREKQLVGVLPLFELKTAQILLIENTLTLKDLQLVVPRKPGLARLCVLLLREILNTRCGKRKLREFAYRGGYALPLILLGDKKGFALRQSAIHDPIFHVVQMQTDCNGSDWAPWGRNTYHELLAAAQIRCGAAWSEKNASASV